MKFLGCGKSRKRFLACNLCDEFQRSANVVNCDVVFTLDFGKRHSACKAPYNGSDSDPRAAYHRLTVEDFWIDHNPIQLEHAHTLDLLP